MARARTDAATVVQTQVTNAVGEAHVAVGQRNASAALMAGPFERPLTAKPLLYA